MKEVNYMVGILSPKKNNWVPISETGGVFLGSSKAREAKDLTLYVNVHWPK